MTGYFDVESDEHRPKILLDAAVLHGLTIISWWLQPTPPSPEPGLLGGYHWFSVEDSDSDWPLVIVQLTSALHNVWLAVMVFSCLSLLGGATNAALDEADMPEEASRVDK